MAALSGALIYILSKLLALYFVNVINCRLGEIPKSHDSNANDVRVRTQKQRTGKERILFLWYWTVSSGTTLSHD
jgi:hypothetical protein